MVLIQQFPHESFQHMFVFIWIYKEREGKRDWQRERESERERYIYIYTCFNAIAKFDDRLRFLACEWI